MVAVNAVCLLFLTGLWILFATAQISTTIPEGPIFYGATVFRKCVYEPQPIKDALIKSVIRINEHFLAQQGSDEPFKQIAKIIKITRREMVLIMADTKCNLTDVSLTDTFFASTYTTKCPIPFENEDETKVWKCSVRKIPTTNGQIIVGHKCGATKFGRVKDINLAEQRDAMNETRTGYRSLINCLYLKPAASQVLLEGLRLINLADATSGQNSFQQVAAIVMVRLHDGKEEEENKWRVHMITMNSKRPKDEETRKLLAKPELFSLFWDVEFADDITDVLECSFKITTQKDFVDTNSTQNLLENAGCVAIPEDDFLKFMSDSFPSMDNTMRTDNPNVEV